MAGENCTWPSCLTPEQSAQLVKEILYEEETGRPYPDPDLTDHRLLCECREAPPGASDNEPPF